MSNDNEPLGQLGDDAEAERLANLAAGIKANPELAEPKVNWEKILRAKVVNATELAKYVDMPIPYVVKPLVVRGSLTQVQGTPKGGKSAFTLYLSLCAATGTWPDVEYWSGPAQPLKVCYLAWEDPEIMMGKRIALYNPPLGFKREFMPKNLNFIFAPSIFIENGDHADAFAAMMDDLKPDIVVVDTLSQIQQADENKAHEMRIPMANLAYIAREKNIGIVYIHHTAKQSNERTAQDKGRGSGAIAAAWHILIDWGVREKNSHVNPVSIISKFEQEWFEWDIDYLAKKEVVGKETVITEVQWVTNERGETPKEIPVKEKKERKILETVELLGRSIPERWCTAEQVYSSCGLDLDVRSIRRILQDLAIKEKLISSRPVENGPFYYRLPMMGIA